MIYAIILIFIIAFFYIRNKVNLALNEPNDIKIDKSENPASSKIHEIKNWDYSKLYSVVGMNYYGVNESHIGHFIGFAVCDNSPYDKFSIAIYDSRNTKIGYISREENRGLNKYIRKYYNGKIYIWGYINSNFNGKVQFPVGLDNEEINEIKYLFSLVDYYSSNNNIENSRNYIQLLENDLKIIGIMKKIPKISFVFYEFRKGIVVSLVKLLENEKDWKTLLEVSKFDAIIKSLGIRNLGYVQKAILKAEEMIKNQNEPNELGS